MPAAIVDASVAVDGLILRIAPKYIEGVCRYLKQNEGFARLSAVTAVDWWPREPRFEVLLLSPFTRTNARLRLSVRVPEGEPLESVCHLWRGANWYEREVFDLVWNRIHESSQLGAHSHACRLGRASASQRLSDSRSQILIPG